MLRFLLGILVGLVLAPVLVLGWLRYGHPPVAVADGQLPFERQIVKVPMHVRIEREMPTSAAIEPTEENLFAGAQVYRDQCASCHGYRDKPSDFADHMFPQAPQLWQLHNDGKTVGVSDDPPGETYWKVANGLRLTGMPAYGKILTEKQIWQVSLLLANADKQISRNAVSVVDGQITADSTEGVIPAKPMRKTK
jgi:mono/diheme cytochrome c family protein